jgi:FkbM family methyltransferase
MLRRIASALLSFVTNKDSVMTILTGPLRGMRWIKGSGNNGHWVGTYEQAVQGTFNRFIRPGQVVYDIGAHVGFYTILAARLAGEEGQVYAFEPFPPNYAYLNRHVQLNGLRTVATYKQAVSDRAGALVFQPGDNTYTGHLVEKVPGPNDIAVKVVTVDGLIAAGTLPPPDFVKVDVEGFEMNALRGMERLIQKNHPIIQVSATEEQSPNVFAFLRLNGYCIEKVTDNDVVAIPTPPRFGTDACDANASVS